MSIIQHIITWGGIQTISSAVNSAEEAAENESAIVADVA